MSRTRFETAELFRIIAGLAAEAIEARRASDDDEDRELLDVYQDAHFQFEGFASSSPVAPAGVVPDSRDALIARLRASLAAVLPYAVSRAEDLDADAQDGIGSDDAAIDAENICAEADYLLAEIDRMPAGVVPDAAPELEICKLLTISTAHVLEREIDAINDGDASLVSHNYDYGLLVWTKDDDCPPEYPNLAALIALARANGCEWLRLDRDGPEVAGLPQFEW